MALTEFKTAGWSNLTRRAISDGIRNAWARPMKPRLLSLNKASTLFRAEARFPTEIRVGGAGRPTGPGCITEKRVRAGALVHRGGLALDELAPREEDQAPPPGQFVNSPFSR